MMASETGRPGALIRLSMVDGTDLRFAHISFGEGPSHSRISAIVEDNQGFVWFGTQDGLRRYDGYRSREYRHDPKNSNSLSGNFIMTLFKDRSGKLWVACDEYLDLFDPTTDVFTHYEGASSNGQISDINQDHDGMIWLATNKGLIRLDPATRQTSRYVPSSDNPQSLSNIAIGSTFEQRDGTFWVATGRGLDVFDRRTGKVTQHLSLPGYFLLHAGPIRLYEDRGGTLWVTFCSGSGLAVVDRRGGRLVQYSFNQDNSENTPLPGVRSILEDGEGTLWLGTSSNGLLKLDRNRSSAVRYRNDPTDPDSLSADRVDSLYEDHEGDIWVGTASGGVNRVAGHPLSFQRFPFERWLPRSLGLNSTLNTLSTVYQDSRGVLWIATVGALDRIDRTTGHGSSYQLTGGPGQPAHVFVRTIMEDDSGHMWFGTDGGGLRRFDLQSGRFNTYRHNSAEPWSLPDDDAESLLIDHKGTLWVATHNGVAALDQKTGRFRTYQMSGESFSQYRAMAQDSDGAIWLGTWDSGVRRLDPATGQFTVYRGGPGSPGSLSSNQVHALCVDKSGTLWVATSTGLNRFDPVTRTFTNYDESNGLPNSNVNGILEDERGDLWLSTSNGISRFAPQAMTFRNYSVADGLPANEFYGANAGFKSRTGEMFFSSRAGLTTFFPEKVVDNPYVPPVVLTDFQLFDQSVPVGGSSPLQQSISVARSLTLTHAQSIFSFEFSALSYANPEKNRYRYRLEWLDSKWNETDSSRRFVTYTTLAPGDYVFRVQGSNNRGIWNENGASVRIHILPPWWSTWWFRAAVAASLLFLLWCAYHLRVRQLKGQEKQLRDVIDAVPANIWSSSPDGAVDFVNQRWQELTGLPPEEARGWNWQAAVHPEDRAGFLSHWRSAIKNGQAMEHEVRVRRADGGYRWLFVRNVPLRDEKGNIAKWYGTSFDIDDRKRAQDALRQTQGDLEHINRVSMMGELAASLAHEIKQPISAAKTNAEACLLWLLRDPPDLPEMREAATEMIRETQRAADIIDRLRSFYRKGTAPLRELVDVNEVAQEMLPLLHSEASRYKVSMRTDLAAGLLKTEADRVQLQQVFMNLMLNGIEAMKDTGGELTIKSEQTESGQLQISITDTGVGLPGEKVDHIFDAFFTTKSQGTGMGLTITRSIIEANGGQLRASANNGRGATFYFTLPREATASSTSAG
ncbi:MAG TPA: two-component regulator propeller domain-containing protein [Edaphobacter sp.]|nr:two-component regulator propeller domain-containing protein [Edaphobacter sp.]